MVISIAYLGPTGTNSETAALAYQTWLADESGRESRTIPCPSIALTLRSVIQQETDIAVVPVENSIEGSVAITLDTLWQLDSLKIEQALILPISHALLSFNRSKQEIKTVYSHPQALAQCQKWLENNFADLRLIPTNSTTEALQYLKDDLTAAAIASPRASSLYNIPVLAQHLNDYPDNCTRFWVVSSKAENDRGNYMSLAFSVPDRPGSLVKPLQVFSQRNINLCRIESRPTKRSLGEYIFFVDLEGDTRSESLQTALAELDRCTEVIKIFGNYNVFTIERDRTKFIEKRL
jgi:prephenate dehydratase